jgi:AraC family transcriptional regulator
VAIIMAMTPDRLRSLIDVLVESIDDPARGEELASRAHFSRFHFERLVAAALRETASAFRRRLLLERSAFELTQGDAVLSVALRAGYGSGEAFARAFARAYGTQPSRFDGRDFRLPAPNGVHFHPPGGLLVAVSERRESMDLADRMIEHDNWLADRLIEAAAALEDRALDEPVRVEPPTEAFADSAPTIRSMLNRLVFTKEMWTAAIKGRSFEESCDTTLPGMRARLERAGAEFVDIVREIRARDAWDTAFVDATCDPPESFSFGGAVAHALAWDAHRRHVVADALRQRGVDVSPDPLAWERSEA